jgi:hypothetical protein
MLSRQPTKGHDRAGFDRDSLPAREAHAFAGKAGGLQAPGTSRERMAPGAAAPEAPAGMLAARAGACGLLASGRSLSWLAQFVLRSPALPVGPIHWR